MFKSFNVLFETDTFKDFLVKAVEIVLSASINKQVVCEGECVFLFYENLKFEQNFNNLQNEIFYKHKSNVFQYNSILIFVN